MSDAYQDTVKRLEPEVAMIDAGAFYASAAISLKRIADALEKLSAQPEVKLSFNVEGQFHDITNLAWEAGQAFKRGTQ